MFIEKFVRITKYNLDKLTANSNLIIDKEYLLYEENRIAVATAINNYTIFKDYNDYIKHLNQLPNIIPNNNIVNNNNNSFKS